MSDRFRQVVREEIQHVLKEYESRAVVEFVGLDEGRLAYGVVEGELDQGSPRRLVDSLEEAGVSFIDGAQLSRSGQTIYITIGGRIGPDTLRNAINTQFRA